MGDSEDIAESGTRIDLGDDLIDKTVVHAPPAAPNKSGDTIAEKIQSAVILRGEGLGEDAKKVLRLVLLEEPQHEEARRMLEEIQANEIKKYFQDEGFSPPKIPSKRAEKIEDVLKRLDQDLGLGLVLGSAEEIRSENFDLVRIEEQLSRAGPKDRMDIGIAFLEMGMHALAIRQFEVLSRTETTFGVGQVLLAQAFLFAGCPFDAEMILQNLLSETELAPGERIEACYLMGRAQEELRKTEAARNWYEKVRELEPAYRDIIERLRALQW